MKKETQFGLPARQGLYDPANEKDCCGVGFVAHVKGKRSHQIVEDAYVILKNMEHRGACGSEPNTGDGAGILTGLPHEFLTKVAKEDLQADLPEPGEYGAGVVFLPTDVAERKECKETVEQIVAQQGQRLVGWRKVPQETVKADVGPTARDSEPHIEQLFIAAGDDLAGDDFERQLYIIRKRASHALRGDATSATAKVFYICSLSTKVIIYKGMLRTLQLLEYYPDLTDADYKTHLAMVHSRCSTNTVPQFLVVLLTEQRQLLFATRHG